jgi:hypothetical protein
MPMIVVDDPVAVGYASTTTMEKGIEEAYGS